MMYHNYVYQSAVYNINQICQGDSADFNPKAIEVPINVPINVYNCNKHSFQYL